MIIGSEQSKRCETILFIYSSDKRSPNYLQSQKTCSIASILTLMFRLNHIKIFLNKNVLRII